MRQDYTGRSLPDGSFQPGRRTGPSGRRRTECGWSHTPVTLARVGGAANLAVIIPNLLTLPCSLILKHRTKYRMMGSMQLIHREERVGGAEMQVTSPELVPALSMEGTALLAHSLMAHMLHKFVLLNICDYFGTLMVGAWGRWGARAPAVLRGHPRKD